MSVNALRAAACGLLLAGAARGSELSSAESADEPFSTISIELSALGDVHDGTFQSYWDPGLGAEIAALAPVPRGFLEIAVHPFSNDPREAGLPDVGMLATWLGWGADVGLPGRVRLRASVRTGVVWMLYDATATTPEQDENELAFGARATLDRALFGAWSIQAGVRAAHLLTHEPIDMVFVGGGIAATFTTPDWLRRFLE